MPTLEIRDRDNKVVGKVEVGEAVFERAVKPSVLHEAVVQYQAGQRRGTHSTKGRADVRGSSRKPWRQKGTGRARAGDRRNPIWRKGGVAHGPHPRDYTQQMPRAKMRRALQMALSSLRQEGRICVLDELKIDAPRTARVAKLLSGLALEGRTLIYDAGNSSELALAARNLPNAKVVTGQGLSVYDLLYYDNLLTSKAGITKIDEALR